MPSFLREYREGLRCPKPTVPSHRPPNFQPGGSPFLAGFKESRPWPCPRQEASLSRGVTRLRSGPCHATRRCSPPPRRLQKEPLLALPQARSQPVPRGHPPAFWPLPCYKALLSPSSPAPKRAAPGLAPGKKPACPAGPPALSRGVTRRGHPLAFWPLPCYNRPQYAT